jgi:hypothetical protein
MTTAELEQEVSISDGFQELLDSPAYIISTEYRNLLTGLQTDQMLGKRLSDDLFSYNRN